jgi:hypothetical protein
MSIRWASLRCVTVLLVVCQASPQAAKRSCGGAGTISLNAAFDDFHSSATLTYNLEQPDKVSNVHIEAWEDPTLLFRTQVSNKRSGRIVWSPKEGILETPSELRLKIHVPENVAGSFSYFLTDRSRALIGRTGSVDGDPVPKLWNETAILEEGAGSISLITEANDVGEQNTVILLMEEEGADVWIAREYLPATMVDLGHVSVEIPAGYLAKPTRLQLEGMRLEDVPDVPIGSQAGGDFDVMTIYVMSKDRPVFSKFEPSKVTYQGGDFDGTYVDAVVHILGSGFSADSEILTGFPAGVGHDSNVLKPIFISGGELQVQIPGYLLRNAIYNEAPLDLWVRNGDNQHVSDPQALTVLPAAKFEVRTKQPRILAVSPYPVPLMDYRTGDGVLLKIYGENFTKNDGVTADHGEYRGLGPAGELKTKFISSQELSAWLPRNLWRSHRLSFRLVAQTSSGVCAVEARQDQ